MENHSTTKTNAWYASKLNLGIPKFFKATIAETVANLKTNLLTRNWLVFLILISGMFANNQSTIAQTNPTAQSLPYSQNFSTFTGSTTTYPAGFQGWTVAGSLSTTVSTATPTADQALAGGTNASASAGVFDMVGKMGLLSTGSAIRTICLAINTTSLTSISVAFDASTQAQTSAGRINELQLQYRIGTSGTFTTVTGSTYSNNATSTINSGTAASNTSNITVTLPVACEGQSNVQLRWIYRDASGSGNRPSFSIDNISISGTAAACSTAENVTSLTASSANLQSVVSWFNGSCFDEMMVVASSSAFTSATPTGNGSAYTANSASFTDGLNTTFDGGKVVYKGTSTSLTVTSLTNGTLYNFKVFTRKGTTWNSGVSTSATPALSQFFWDADGNTTVATGGTGTWDNAATSNWRSPNSTGTLGTWSLNTTPLDAVFGGTAGTVSATGAITFTAPNFNFTTTNYTVSTTSTTAITVAGNVVLGNNINLNLSPNVNIVTPANGTINFGGNITGTGTAGLTLNAAQSASLNLASRINLSTSGATLSVPVTINSAGGTGTELIAAIVGTNTNTSLASTATITNNTSLKTGIGATSGNAITVNSVIGGSADLIFAAGGSGGAGTVTLNGTNTYLGATIFNMGNTGTIKLGNSSAIPSGSPVTMGYTSGNGGILDLNGFNPSFGSLTNGVGGGSITNNNTTPSTPSILTINGTTSTSFGLAINNGATNSVGITKNGSSTLTLTTAGSFSGATTVTGGTLLINAVNTGLSATSVGASGTFGGSGTAPGTLSVSGTVAPGSTGTSNVGTFTTGAQTWNSGATYDLTMSNVSGTAGTNWDYVTTSSASNFGTNATNIVVGGTVTGFSDITSYTWKILTATGGITGFNAANFTLNTAVFGAFTGSFSVAQSGNDVNLIYTPLAVSISVGALTPGGAFNTNIGSPSAVQTFTISGANLLTVSVAALAGYEYSDDGFSTAPQSSLSYGAAVSFSKTISVRLIGASGGTFNGNIVVSATGVSAPTGSPANVAVTGLVSSPVITVSSPSQIASGNIQQGSLEQPLTNFQINVANVSSGISSISFSTGGSYTATDITNFKLWYNANSNDFNSALQLGSTITSIPVAPGPVTFSGLTNPITAGNTGYYWLTASISGTAVVTRTINVLANPTVTYTLGSSTGSISAGGNQTIIAPNGLFSQGNIAVEVVGDGVTALSANATRVSIFEYGPMTNNQTSALSTTIMTNSGSTPSSAPFNCVETGSGTSNGYLNRSSDGTLLSVSGYNTALATASVAASTVALPNFGRTVGIVSADRTVNTNNTVNMLSGNNYRSLVSNGFSYWAAGAAGIAYLQDAASTTPVSISSANTRCISIFNNNLYYSTGSGTQGIYQIGSNGQNSGLPTTTGQAATLIVGVTAPYGFSINPASNIMYIAIDATYANTSAGGGVQKYTYNGTAWVYQYTLQMRGTTAGARGLTVDWSGATPVIYATTNEGSLNTVIRIVDNGQTSGNSGTLLAQASANRIFRGVASAPVGTTTSRLFSTSNSFSFPTTEVNLTSSVQTFNASGYNLGGASNLTVTVPAGFFVSTSPTGPFNSTTAIVPVFLGSTNAPFYIQFAPTVATTINSSVIISAFGSFASNVFVPISGTGVNPTPYYLVAGGNVTNTGDWGTNTNGSGSNPTDFVSANQSFIITNNATVNLSGSWTVSGLNSSVKVGNGVSVTNFVIASSATYSSSDTRVNNNGTITLQNSTVPTFTNLATGSTVVYNQSVNTNVQNIAYYNLTLLGSGGSPTFSLPITGSSVPMAITGNLRVDGANAIGTNTSPFTYVKIDGNVIGANAATFGVASPQNSGNIFSIITNGNGNQSLDYNGGTMRFFTITSTKSAGNFNITAGTTVETFNQSGFNSVFSYSGTSSITTGAGSLLRSNVNGNTSFVLSGSATMTLGGDLSTTGTGGSTLATPVGTAGSLFFDLSGTSTFNDGGNTISCSNNFGMKGSNSAYNLTGTLIMAGTALAVSPKIENDNTAQGVIDASLNNLVISPNGCTNIDFQPATGSAAITIKGNLTINAGAMTGLVRMFGNNISVGGNFTNNRTANILNPGTSTLEFNGTSPQIYQTSVTAGDNLFNLKLSNSNGLTISGSNDINITSTGNVNCSNGIITTNANKIILSNTATITETSSKYVSGFVQTTRNALLGVNQTFGGIGFELNGQSAAPGSTLILREIGSSTSAGCSNSSILRKYTVTPTTTSGLNADVVFNYFDTPLELNGIPENTLSLFSGVSSFGILSSTQDISGNTLSISGVNAIPASSKFIASAGNAPTVTVGGSQTICVTGTATVPAASFTNQSSILWTHDGAGSFGGSATSAATTPTYTPSALDGGNTVTLTLTVNPSTPCLNPVTATHTVNVVAAPTANAGSASSTCVNQAHTVTGATSANGTRLWTHNGTGNFNGNQPTSTSLNPTYTPSLLDAGNTVTLTLTVSNASCSDAVSTAALTVGSLPTALAGGSAITCENGTVTVSGASTTNSGIISWAHNGNGTLANPGTLTPTYTAVAADAGTIVTLTMTANGIAPCGLATATATYVINVRPRPTVAVTLGPNAICNDGNGVARKLTVTNSEANTTYSWSPATDLYIDAAYTIPYTNQNVTEVWAVPFVTTSYTVTATNNTSLCTTPASLPTTITVCNNLTDLICGASDIAVNSTGAWTTISLIGSTASAGIPCAVVERDVYRRVQVPASGELHVTTAAGTNSTASLNIQRTLVSIHYAQGGTCTTSPSIACNSTGAAGNHSYVYATGLTPGEYAWIRIAKAKANLSDPNTVAQELRINVAPGLTWTGSASTAFTNPSNWLNGDATSVTVPDAAKSVLVRQGTNQPVVSTNEQIRGLITTANGHMTINTGNTLSMTRNVTGANTNVYGNGWAILNGTTAQIIDGTITFSYLRVNNNSGVSITAPSRVGGLDLQQGALSTGGNLTVLSNAGLTGYINNFSVGYIGSIVGTVNMERRVVLANTSANANHYITSPVAMVGTVSSNYNDDFSVVGNPAGYVYNSSPNSTQPTVFPSTWTWDETLTNINTPGWTGAGGTTLLPGQGFSARIPGTQVVDIVGIPNNGAINRTITYTAGDGLNLIGNPYPSSINFNSFATANSASILPILYAWNAATNSYASYNGSTWTNNPGGILASDVIGHSQSFFVFAKPSVAPSGTVNFNNTMRTTSQAANFFSAPEGLIRLEVSSNGHTDEAVVMTNAEATENYDEQVDAKKLLNPMNPNILAFTLSADNTPLAINALDKYSAEQIIPVQVIAPTAGDVNIKLNLSDLKDKYENVYLEDATLGTFTDLKANGSYTAAVSAGNSGSRFFLHFEKPSVAKAANELGVYAANTTVFANLPSESNGTIEVVDLVGKTIYTANFAGKSGRVAFEIPNAVYGSYIVKLTSNGKVVNQKVVLNQ